MFIREGRVIPVQSNLKGVLSTKDLDNFFDLKIGLKKCWKGGYWARGYVMVIEKFSDERVIECVEEGCLAEVEVEVYNEEENIQIMINIRSKKEKEGGRKWMEGRSEVERNREEEKMNKR